MAEPVSIGLVFDYELAFPRGVLRGIKQYAQARPEWVLVLHDAEGFTPATLETMHPVGLISNVVSRELATILHSLKRPVVNVGSVLPDLPFPQVSVDHREVGRLALEHLWERGLRHFGFVGHPRHLRASAH